MAQQVSERRGSVGLETVTLPTTTLDLEPFRRELTGYCYRVLGSGFEAEDAVQETMVRAWRHAEGFEGRAGLRSWLYRIATNVCIDMSRQVQRRARPMEMSPASSPQDAPMGAALPEASAASSNLCAL
jgi:RNA polymerase sigma-70 factor, ECF subfamily